MYDSICNSNIIRNVYRVEAMRLFVVLLIGMVLFSFVWANPIPLPEKPQIFVQFKKVNKSYTGITDLMYHCVKDKYGTDVSTKYKITYLFDCRYGVCNNKKWFVEGARCFYSSGYFTYEYKNAKKKTGVVDFNKEKKYIVTVDVKTGNVLNVEAKNLPGFGSTTNNTVANTTVQNNLSNMTNKTGKTGGRVTICAIVFVLPLLLLGMFAGCRK